MSALSRNGSRSERTTAVLWGVQASSSGQVSGDFVGDAGTSRRRGSVSSPLPVKFPQEPEVKDFVGVGTRSGSTQPDIPTEHKERVTDTTPSRRPVVWCWEWPGSPWRCRAPPADSRGSLGLVPPDPPPRPPRKRHSMLHISSRGSDVFQLLAGSASWIRA